MAYGSTEKKNIKTKRISSSSILNAGKKHRLAVHFKYVKFIKNKMSKHIFNNKHMLLNVDTKKELISNAKLFNNKQMYSWEVQKLFQSIVDYYSNWIDQLVKNNKFKLQKEFKITYYKRNVKNKDGLILKNKGSLKLTEMLYRHSKLSNLTNWLIYVEDSKLDSVLKSIPLDPKKLENAIQFNNEIERIRSVSYWERIKDLLLSKKKNILRKIKEPIVFKTGSYMKTPQIGKTKHSHFHIDENNTYQHWYKFRIGKDHIHVPLSFNKKYHDDLNNFNLEAIHSVRLNTKNHIDIGLTYEDEKEYFKPLKKDSIIEKEKLCGIDINVASNFCTIAFHDGTKSFDYDRSYVEKVVKQLLVFEEKVYKQLTNQEQKQLEKLLRGVEFQFKHLISNILKELVNKKITDIVLEDLNLTQCKASFLRDKDLNIKYSKLIRLLRLSSVKGWFEEQANNKGIRVHLTNPAYTSKTCSKCQCVLLTHREGRSFQCKSCSHKEDADSNASNNIYNRIFVEVLRNSLHILKEGQYRPSLIRRKQLQIKLNSLFEADNERQLGEQFSAPDTRLLISG